MEIFGLIVAFFLIILLFRRTSRLRDEVESLTRRLNTLTQPPADEVIVPTEEVVAIVEAEAVDVEEVAEVAVAEVEVAESEVVQAVADEPIVEPEPASFRSETWKRREQFILENLTGILGTLGVVLGLGFLGVYTALMLEPFFRVVSLASFSVFLTVVTGFTLRLEKWRGLSQWVQSAGVALFLFACLGSGGVPGLQWTNDPLLSWGLLSVGVLANLGLAYVRRTPVFASVHALLSLAALAVAGPSLVIVGTMGVVAVGSLLLIQGKNWQLHLALTELAFVGVLALFYLTGAAPTEEVRVVATGGLLVLFTLGQSTHFRKVYASAWNTGAALTHLLVWALTCAGLFLYAPQHDWLLSPALLAVSLVVGLAARLARRRGILWLYKIDTLFSLASALGAALSLVVWQLALTPAVLIALVVSLGFTLLTVLEGELLLARVGARVTEVLSVVIAGLSVTGADALALTLAASLLAVFQGLVTHRLKALAPRSLFDFLLPWLVVLAALVVPNGLLGAVPSGFGLLVPLVALCSWYRVRASRLLRLGLQTATAVFSLVQWGRLVVSLVAGSSDWLFTLLVSVPLLLIPLAAVLLAGRLETSMRRPMVVSFGVNLALTALLVLWPLSPSLVPLAWAVLGLAFSGARARVGGVGNEFRILGLALMLGSLVLYTPFFVGGVIPRVGLPLRWGLEGLVVALFFLRFSLRGRDSITPLFLEASLFLALVSVLGEVPIAWLPLTVAAASTVLLVVSFVSRSPRRLPLHASFGVPLSSALMVWVAFARLAGPELWWSALAQALALVLLFRAKRPQVGDYPELLSWLARVSTPLFRRLSLFAIVPLGVAWALSLAFTFDSTVLTLLWSLESFALFALALILREPLFRWLSLTSLGVCLVRLVFFDLVQADTLSRALVFLGMGVLMILMNILYLRFKNRMSDLSEKEEELP